MESVSAREKYQVDGNDGFLQQIKCDCYEPKVSIIMAVYNSNLNYLKASVESILAQTFAEFEFVICDDGSSPDVIEFLEEISKNDSRIRVLHNSTNMGLPFSLNKCLNASRSDIVARMDDDDISSPYRIEIEYSFLTSHPKYSFCSSEALLIDETGHPYRYLRRKKTPSNAEVALGTQFVHPSTMVRRKDLFDVGCYSSNKLTRIGRCEDYDLWNRLYYNGHIGANLKKPLLCYRELKTSYKKRTLKSRRVHFKLKKIWWKKWKSKGVKINAFGKLKAFLISVLPPKFLFLLHVHNGQRREDVNSLYIQYFK